jgi:hypothetical protein
MERLDKTLSTVTAVNTPLLTFLAIDSRNTLDLDDRRRAFNWAGEDGMAVVRPVPGDVWGWTITIVDNDLG